MYTSKETETKHKNQTIRGGAFLGLPPLRPPVKIQFHNIDILQNYTPQMSFSYTNVYVKQIFLLYLWGVRGAFPPEKKIVIWTSENEIFTNDMLMSDIWKSVRPLLFRVLGFISFF